MRDLVGLPEVARILKKSRARAWQLYKAGMIEPAAMSGTDTRPRPLFNRSTIERLAEKVAEKGAA